VALRRIGDLYFDAGFADSAHASYVEMGRLARDEATFRQAELKVADALVRLDQAPEAIERLRNLLPREEAAAQTRQTETWAAEIHVGLARAYNANGEHGKALESLRKVTSAYSSSSFTPEAQFQIGYTYETYMDSLDAARAAYDQAARIGASSVYREQAQQRSRNLQQLQTLRSAAQSDTATGADRAAEAQLRLAELYLLSQNKPEEALPLYRLILEQYPESRVAPRAAYAVSWTLLRRQEGMRDSALAGFADLVRRYPASAAARGAIDLLVDEKADTAGLGALLVALQPDTAAADTTADEAPAPATHGPQTSPGVLPPGLAPGLPDTTGARLPAALDTSGARSRAPIDSAGGAIPVPPDTASPSVPAPVDTLPPPEEKAPAPLPGRTP
jgi:tetratricopeptide (TPR) repeat protein